MYKCTECGMEYDIKPDFCDCGNDIFVEEKVKENIKQNEQIILKQKESNDLLKKNATLSKQHMPDIFSVLIFLFCIILSFFIAFIPVNKNESTNLERENKDVNKYQMNEIPSIDKFWNSSLPAIEKKVNFIELTKTSENNSVSINKVFPAKVEKTMNNNATAKPQSKSMTNVVPKQVNTVKTVKKAQNQSKSIEKSVQLQDQSKNVNDPVNTAALIQIEQKDSGSLAAEEAAREFQKQQELNTYKSGLRNTIARKIDFTQVIGDGNCIVSFKVNVYGQLFNKSFKQQSDNLTLNEAVFKAINTITSYNPPPEGYNQEILILNIKIYNGNFEITLK